MIEMNTIHYSRKPLKQIYSVKPCEQSIYNLKPNGLWITFDTKHDWSSYVKKEFGDGSYSNFHRSLSYRNLLKISGDILVLDTDKKVVEFHNNFCKNRFSEKKFPSNLVDWKEVSKKFDGFVVNPYNSNLFLRHKNILWHRSLSCASGCIWNAAAIEIVGCEKNKP